MGFVGEVWQVRGGEETAGELVGEILIDDADFPWLSGKFTAGPAFDAVRELFARELALADDDWTRWEEAYDEVRRQVTLTSPDGPVPEFLLHIEGERAWFRWSDEPFDDDEDGDEAAPGGE